MRELEELGRARRMRRRRRRRWQRRRRQGQKEKCTCSTSASPRTCILIVDTPRREGAAGLLAIAVCRLPDSGQVQCTSWRNFALFYIHRHSWQASVQERPRGIGSGCGIRSVRTRHNTNCIKQECARKTCISSASVCDTCYDTPHPHKHPLNTHTSSSMSLLWQLKAKYALFCTDLILPSSSRDIE